MKSYVRLGAAVAALFLSATSAHAQSGIPVAGGDHTCLLLPDGRIACWGANDKGQLGLGDVRDRVEPTIVPGVDHVEFLALGGANTCATSRVDTTTTATRCWGANVRGQLGTGAPDVFPHWHGVSFEDTDSSAIGIGEAHVIVGFEGYLTKAAGANERGQLGVGDRMDRTLWAPIPNNVSSPQSIGAGLDHSCAEAHRHLFCWGAGGRGQLGIGSTADMLVPTEVPLPSGAVSYDTVVAGAQHTCAIYTTTSGSKAFACWGANNSGQIGKGTILDYTTPQVVFSGGTKAVAAGQEHTCAATPGLLACWGNNNDGQLGIGTSDFVRLSPTVVPNMDVDRLTAGANHTCARTVDGKVMCWGKNHRGQLGIGTDANSNVPIEVHPVVDMGVIFMDGVD